MPYPMPDDSTDTAAPAPWYAHAIGGGWDIRHAECAARCCNTMATRWPLLTDEESMMECAGCGGVLGEKPAKMSFDRDEMCETCADAREEDEMSIETMTVTCAICASCAHVDDASTPAATATEIAYDPARDGLPQRTVYACPECVSHMPVRDFYIETLGPSGWTRDGMGPVERSTYYSTEEEAQAEIDDYLSGRIGDDWAEREYRVMRRHIVR